MRYVPDEKPKKTLKDKSSKWCAWAIMFVLLGPFAIIYIAAFAGGPVPGGWFNHWFMGALTVGGLIVSWDTVKSIKHHGLGELGCAVPLIAATAWWGWIFLKGIGLVE